MTINFRRGRGNEIIDQILNIKVDGSSAARIVVNIEGQDKIALIDTGAGRCCMNEEQYRTLGSHLWNPGCGVPTEDCLWSPYAWNGFPYM